MMSGKSFHITLAVKIKKFYFWPETIYTFPIKTGLTKMQDIT